MRVTHAEKRAMHAWKRHRATHAEKMDSTTQT